MKATVTGPARSKSDRRRLGRSRRACRIAAVGAALTVSVLAGLAAYGQSPAGRSITDGVFSAAQVERGREQFLSVCMDCHEMAEFTAAGAYFDEMEGEDLYEVFEYIWLEMPEDRPAWYPPEDYADVLAYMLSVYGMPAGEADLPIDEAVLEQIVIEPAELPGS